MTSRINDPGEIRRLTLLAHQFANPCDTKEQLTLETCLFDLSWNLPPLEFAIVELLGNGSPLQNSLVLAEGHRARTMHLWRQVEVLPYGTVRKMIDTAQHRYWGPRRLPSGGPDS